MTQPRMLKLFSDWCYQVTLRTSEGLLAHPNIQAPDEADCRHRVEVLYQGSTVLAITPVHRSQAKYHNGVAVRIFRRHADLRPVERRVTVRRRSPSG